VLIASGRTAEGVALLDDAMTSVLAGELTPFFTGIVYCNVIAACLDLSDLRRASEWADASAVWCETLPPDSPFPGLCRVNRAVVARMAGSLDEAEAEATVAAEHLVRFAPEDARHAFYQVGEIRLERGDLAGAQEAFDRARELGSDVLPGVALLRLAEGKPREAATALRLADDTKPPPERARILAAGVDVALADDDLETARSRAAELEALAAAFPAPPFEALAAVARGSVLLAGGDPQTGLDALRRACGLWHDLKLPYETARARALCGRALMASGDADAGEQELRAARAVFEQLGAVADAAAIASLVGESSLLPAGLTAREAEVLRLVASGKTNRDIAVELVLSVHTVGRHLQNIFAKLGVSTRAAATAYAFEHGLA
jgi:DNA-binding CsgD family transcriptional regulator